MTVLCRSDLAYSLAFDFILRCVKGYGVVLSYQSIGCGESISVGPHGLYSTYDYTRTKTFTNTVIIVENSLFTI